jgi:hypothetical protein
MEPRRVALSLAVVFTLSLVFTSPARAQSITDYALSPSSGSFTPLTGATFPARSGGTLDDGYYNALPIGFTFDFNGTTYTQVSATTNGCLFPGATLSSSALSNNLTSGTPRPVIAPLWDDIEIADSLAGGSFSYKTEGTTGSQIFTAQWLNMFWTYAATTPALSFQVKLYEADGHIEFIYRDEGNPTGGTPGASIGLAAIGTGSGNFLSLNGTGPAPGVSSTTETSSLSTKPASGQVYSFSRTAMTYTSCTVTQNTAGVSQGAANAQVIGIEVVMDGAVSPLSITQLNLNTTGTTSTADILNAKLYYTGTSSTFAATGQFGSTVTSPAGTFSFTGSQTLAGGTNYFWLTYDVSPTATVNNLLDAQCTQITVAGTPRTPTVTAPAGSRQIRAAMAGTYTIDPGGSGGTNYTSFTAALADLNLLGLAGPVTFNIKAGAVFTGALTLTATGTLSAPIVFQRSGAGANPVIEDAGTGATTEWIVRLVGSDYVTFDGIDLRPTAGSTAMEWGYYFLGSATDGCQHNTVKNCVITMDRANTNARGVYLSSFATAAAGANSGNKFYNNTIRNTYVGYWLNGASAVADDGNEIGTVSGGSSLIRTLGGSTTGSYGVYYGYQTSCKVFDTTIDSISTTSGTVAGIYNSGGTVNTVEISNTVITHLSSSSGTVYGIYGGFSGTSYSLHGNAIAGLTCATSSVYGLYHAGGTTVTAYRNSISDLSYTGTGSSTVYGVYISSGTTHTLYNNFIYDLRAPASTSTTPASGIYISSGTTINLYDNSVLLNYAGTTASNLSTALYVSSLPTTVDMRGNIFVNLCDMTTGTRAVAFWKGTIALTNISPLTNYNLYYAGVPGAKNLIYYDGTNADQTLAAYKARIATRDQVSVTENPPFLSSTAPYNLHMNTAAPTQTESGGTPVTSPVAITEDIDGNPRNVATPDIGADEFNGLALDVTGPQIAYVPLLNSVATPSRPLVAAITDLVSGVQKSAAGKPRAYFRKGAAGPYSSGIGTESPANTWTFTIDHTAIGATAVGDTVYYYVAAQDSSANAATNPAGTSPTINPPNATVAAPNFYKIAPVLVGAVTIGSAGPEVATFPNVKAFFDSVNACVVTGAVTATLTSSVTETAPAVLHEVAYGAGGPFTITLKPAPATTDTITGAIAGAVISLSGADHVVFDGSNSGGTDRNLTILNTSTVSATAAIALSSLGTGLGATDNTLKNLNIACGVTQNTSTNETFAIFAGGAAVGTTSDGPDNDNLTIRNNRILRARWGVYVRGMAGNPNSGLTIESNVVGPDSFGVDEIGKGGVVLQYQDGATVTQNEIRFVGGAFTQTTSGTDRVGIGVGAGDGWPGATATIMTNTSVTRNLIHDVVDERTYSAIGIGLAALGAGTNNIVANNMMYNLRGNGTAGDMTVGLCLAAGDGDKVVYNSILLTGDIDPAGGSSNSSVSSTGFRIVSASITNLLLKNNIAVVDLNSNTATLKHYAIIAPSGFAWGTGSANNNDYYVNAANPQMVLGGIGASTPFTDVATLPLWRTQFTPNQDAASVSGDPLYVSGTNLHISGTSVVANAGSAVPGVTTDYDGEVRSGGTPDIGADEFAGGGTVVAVSIAAGWNMISNPVTTASDSLRQLFGSNAAFPYAFAFASGIGYQQDYTLENGRGYWAKFLAPDTRLFTGGTRTLDTIDVVTGWNMVGSISSAVDTSTIVSLPPGIRPTTNYWYGYSGSYAATTSLLPGKGYWIKVNAPGQFVLASGPAPEKAVSSGRGALESMNSITIKDALGRSQTLYFGTAKEAMEYAMPPLPPEGAFDARFTAAEGGAIGKTHAADAELPISIQSAVAPLTVSWSIRNGEYVLDAGQGLKPVAGEGTLTLGGAVSRLMLRSAGVEIPTTYMLQQNYPNPFNPSTTIQFGLPAASRVRVEVYNLLGQHVSTLVNNLAMDAGYQTVEWKGTGSDGRQLGSGVYFVRFAAEGSDGKTFTDVRKMMLMK